MDITEQILAIIELVKAQPNSLERNKTMSHLQDARVWSYRLIPRSPADEIAEKCNCPNGGIRADCPIHGSN